MSRRILLLLPPLVLASCVADTTTPECLPIQCGAGQVPAGPCSNSCVELTPDGGPRDAGPRDGGPEPLRDGGPRPDPCENVNCDVLPLPECTTEMEPQAVNATSCVCVATMCAPQCQLTVNGCEPIMQCPEGHLFEAGACVPYPQACWEGSGYQLPNCIQALCSEHPFAEDGTDLRAVGKCIEDPPAAPETCTDGCHNGISHPHASGGVSTVTCTGCHGGDPSARTRETAHVPIPIDWQRNSVTWGRPNLRFYWNYLTLTGVERFDGGLEWLRFRNPGDLRVADQTCGRDSGCHQDRVENVRRSVMATSVGLVGVSQARSGLPRTVIRDGDGVYQWDTTEGITRGGTLIAIAYDAAFTGSVRELRQFETTNRANTSYGEIDVLREIYDKACGGCHLGSAGRNDRYGDFRSSGCTSCHMHYALDGRSRSADQMIRKDEPSYPSAFQRIANLDSNDLGNLNGNWLGPERAHPINHRIATQMPSHRCGTCHSGSNRTDWQFRGYQIDPNRTVQALLGNNLIDAQQFAFTDEIADVNFGRYHGLAQDQVLRFVDWNNDGLDDIPADVHWQAGLECMDCHTSGEMHNEQRIVKREQVVDWADPAQVTDMSGAIWSHMDQATEIECVHCHGNLENRARGYTLDNRNPIRNLIVCPEAGEMIPANQVPPECANLGRGRWLRSKFTGNYHYVSQVMDTVAQSAVSRPNGAPVYTLNASIFHGRVNADPNDGVGPCTNGDPNQCRRDIDDPTSTIRDDFSHLGAPATSRLDQHSGGLECYACHATWANMCFGCHLRLTDNNGNQILRDFSKTTGELTYGKIVENDLTYISPRDIQLGINSEGKIAQFLPESKQQVAHTDADGTEFFGTRVIVDNDRNISYNAYRHRAGYGLRRWATELVGLPYPSAGPISEQFAQMDENAGQGANQFMPHTVQRAHPAMDCVSSGCHIDRTQTNSPLVTARWMNNPSGFAFRSQYLATLSRLGEIIRNDSQQSFVVDEANGFLLGSPNVDPTAFNVAQQADYCALPVDGFPLCYNNHPMKRTPGAPTNPPWPATYIRTYPTLAPIAGPLNTYLSNVVNNQVRVADEGVVYRGAR